MYYCLPWQLLYFVSVIFVLKNNSNQSFLINFAVASIQMLISCF